MRIQKNELQNGAISDSQILFFPWDQTILLLQFKAVTEHSLEKTGTSKF